MEDKDARTKRAAIRREIKERMQKELDRRKKDIKTRLKNEQISVQEKRRRYRSDVKQEKLLLMSLAKEEFRARKRMVGLPTREEEEPFSEPPPIPPEVLRRYEEQSPPKDEPVLQHYPDAAKPGEAFVYEDKEDSDIRELQTPINASDARPLGTAAEDIDSGKGIPKKQTLVEEEGHGLFHYIINLVIHPIQTMDEFDDYLGTRFGIAKIILFYLVSLLPIMLFLLIGEEIVSRMPHGLLWSFIGANAASEGGSLAAVALPVFDLLFYSLIIAIINYFVANEANFVTLTIYFAFVEAVTRIAVYSFIVLAVFAALMAAVAPQVLVAVGLLFLAFVIWDISLNIIVLMTAYGYNWFTAISVSFFALIARIVLRNFLLSRLFENFSF
jgi:hypothetical protein